MLTWKEVDGQKTAKARLAVKGYQEPDLRMGNVDIACCVSRRSSHLQLISLGASERWALWGLDIKNALVQAGGFDPEIHLRAPRQWNSKDTRRVWKLRAPARGLEDAPVASRRSLREYLVNFAESLCSVGLRFEVSSFGPCVYFIFRKSVGAVGVIATNFDDIPGCGEPD